MEDADEDGVDEIADPLARAVALKNKGNKYFKGGRYSQAVKCYSEAIDNCPKENKSDLSTFYQNRAAAYEQMVRFITTHDLQSRRFHSCPIILKVRQFLVQQPEKNSKWTSDSRNHKLKKKLKLKQTTQFSGLLDGKNKKKLENMQNSHQI